MDDLPDTVMTIFQNAIDSANSGIVNWVMRRRAMRYLTFLTIPYRVPIDIMYATFTKWVYFIISSVSWNIPSIDGLRRQSVNWVSLEPTKAPIYTGQQHCNKKKTWHKHNVDKILLLEEAYVQQLTIKGCWW